MTHMISPIVRVIADNIPTISIRIVQFDFTICRVQARWKSNINKMPALEFSVVFCHIKDFQKIRDFCGGETYKSAEGDFLGSVQSRLENAATSYLLFECILNHWNCGILNLTLFQAVHRRDLQHKTLHFRRHNLNKRLKITESCVFPYFRFSVG